jgi:uncharacterized membrane protein
MSKFFKLAVIISLTLNVILIGLLLGELPRRFDRGNRPGERIRRDVEKLPEPLRARFREKMEQARQGGMRQKLRQERDEAIRILAAEPFDEAAYDRQVKKIQELRLQMHQRMAENIKELAKGLPQEQRQALAEVLKRPPPRTPR